MLPAGWNTYVGVALKILSMVMGILEYMQGQPISPLTFSAFAGGTALTASGQAKQSTLVKGIALQEKVPIEDAHRIIDAKK